MTPALHQASLLLLRQSKNLLAFSAGVDSSALFFLLLEADIPFDLAIVDYQLRPQSAQEIIYAKELGSRYNKTVHTKTAWAGDVNFEATARKIRYDFFNDLCQTHGYTTIVTAHQLNDRLEWFLMQLTKGAGLPEMLGMDFIAQEAGYTLVRPMLELDRDTIIDYLHRNKIRYFTDESNRTFDHTRNFFRHTFAQPLLKIHRSGIQKSFDYLRKDADTLCAPALYRKISRLIMLRSRGDLSDIREIDYHLKRIGYLLSSAQKQEIERTRDCVIGGKIVVTFRDGLIYIAPHVVRSMSKKDKEAFRSAKIPPKIRPYLDEEKISLHAVMEMRNAILNSARTH
jgi:tRNA(Ile)-lysidine synthase